MKILIVYIPVLHSGYERFLLKHRDADKLLIFGEKTIASFEWLRKDLRCLNPLRVVQSVRSWGIFPDVQVLDDVSLSEITSASEIVMPDETECYVYAEQFLFGLHVTFDSVSLRYDKKKTESVSSVVAEEVNSDESLRMMNIALCEASKSPDWWLHVGALIAKNGQILLVAHNEHKPSPREALFMGDPRSNYGRGINIELSVSDHAEKVLVGEAARRGISLEDSDLYVTVFPCPPCARLVRRTGIKRCFFKDGYAMMLESDQVLRSEGIEIFHVKT